jgi:hypothetical protein
MHSSEGLVCGTALTWAAAGEVVRALCACVSCCVQCCVVEREVKIILKSISARAHTRHSVDFRRVARGSGSRSRSVRRPAPASVVRLRPPGLSGIRVAPPGRRLFFSLSPQSKQNSTSRPDTSHAYHTSRALRRLRGHLALWHRRQRGFVRSTLGLAILRRRLRGGLQRCLNAQRPKSQRADHVRACALATCAIESRRVSRRQRRGCEGGHVYHSITHDAFSESCALDTYPKPTAKATTTKGASAMAAARPFGVVRALLMSGASGASAIQQHGQAMFLDLAPPQVVEFQRTRTGPVPPLRAGTPTRAGQCPRDLWVPVGTPVHRLAERDATDWLSASGAPVVAGAGVPCWLWAYWPGAPVRPTPG